MSTELEQTLKEWERVHPPHLVQIDHSLKIDEDPQTEKKIIELARKLISLGYGQIAGRGDEELIRHLNDQHMTWPDAKHREGAKGALEDWLSKPIFQFRAGEHNMDLWDTEINLPEGMTRSEFGIKSISQAFDNLPFADLQLSIYDIISGHTIYAMVTGSGTDKFNLKINEGTVRVIWWLKGKFTPFRVGIYFHVRGDDGNYYLTKIPSDPNAARLNKDDVFVANCVGCCLSYIQQTSKHAVEVSIAEPRITGSTKTGRKKPWLREDRKHIIYIDPYKARQHGHNAVSLGDGPKRKAHARRGHWRHYRVSEKRERELLIFVRPAWIGAGEWKHQGKTYKVIKDKKVEHNE